ncbi:MAG: EamA family transporter [Thaumarchaeota archaeon]|nr:EamA family transporter [Nitrososphaerota archaeon]
MVYTPVIFGLAAAFCWGTADYLSRRQSEKVGYYPTVVYSHLVTFVILIALLPLLTPTIELAPIPTLILVGAGLLNFLAFIFLYRAFHKGVVSVVAPIAYAYPAVTAVFSILILGTILAQTQALAISGIILGVVLLSTRLSELRAFVRGRGAPNLRTGVESAVSSSFFFGLVYVALGYSAPLLGYALPPVLLRAVGVATGFILAPLLHQALRPSRQNLSGTIVAMGFLEAVGFLAFSYGISVAVDSLPIVAALSGMGGAVASAYAMVFLKERLEKNQALGLVLSLAGVFTLLYLGG